MFRSLTLTLLLAATPIAAIAASGPWFVIDPEAHSCLPAEQAFEGASSPDEIAKLFASSGLHYRVKLEEDAASLLSTDRGRDSAILLYKNLSVCKTLARLRWEQR